MIALFKSLSSPTVLSIVEVTNIRTYEVSLVTRYLMLSNLVGSRLFGKDLFWKTNSMTNIDDSVQTPLKAESALSSQVWSLDYKIFFMLNSMSRKIQCYIKRKILKNKISCYKL